MDRLIRLRTTLAVVALIALTLALPARVALLVLRDPSATGLGTAGPVLLVVAGLTVLGCSIDPAVRGLHGLARWGFVVVLAWLLWTVVAAVPSHAAIAAGPATSARSLLLLVPQLGLVVVVGLVLLALAREDVTSASAPQPTGPDPDDGGTDGPDRPAPDPDLQPAWDEDVAAGAVWRTAGEAASGAPAYGWGGSERSGELSSGWPLPALEERRGPDEPADR